MRYLLTIFFSSLVLIVIAAFGLVAVTRTDLYPLNVDPASEYLPGHSMPPRSTCDWHSYQFGYYYCNVQSDKGPITFIYHDGTISYTSRPVNNITLGRLILAWGEPMGYLASGQSVRIYWLNRYATLLGDPFTPMTNVSYVSYDSEPSSPYDVKPLPWHGFTAVK